MLVRISILLVLALTFATACQRKFEGRIELLLFDINLEGRIAPEQDGSRQVRDRLMSDRFWWRYVLPQLARKNFRPIDGMVWRDEHLSITPSTEFGRSIKQGFICNFIVHFRGTERAEAELALNAIADAYEACGAERWKDAWRHEVIRMNLLETLIQRTEGELATPPPGDENEIQQKHHLAQWKQQLAQAKTEAANRPPPPFAPLVKSVILTK